MVNESTVMVYHAELLTSNGRHGVRYAFNNQGESTIVISGEANNIIVASAIGNLESDAKKKYVINNKDIERKI